MDNPKVSVLIPMYNRKHYIAQCVDSALNQTFSENYEIIIRDNCSTDGSYEFVAEKYAKEIADGKIRLYRNEENIGQWRNVSLLITDAAGKYIMVLHSDDMYLPHAVWHLYDVAEKTNADVVHSSFFLNSPKDGIINDVADCKPACMESTVFDKVTIMSDEPVDRFIEWSKFGTFCDIQHNIFKKKFAIDNLVTNGIFLDGFWDTPVLSVFCWIMTAKIFVKTPIISYIRRNAPDSITNTKINVFPFENFIGAKIGMIRYLDYLLPKIEFFRKNKLAGDFVKMKFIIDSNNLQMTHKSAYKNGLSNEIYENIENAFKTHFGSDYFFPMIFYHWFNSINYCKNDILNIMFQNSLNYIKQNFSSTPSEMASQRLSDVFLDAH